MILSIIYLTGLQVFVWETNALLKIKDTKTMQIFSRIKQEQRVCDHESGYLLFPYSCEKLFVSLERSNWLDLVEVKLMRMEAEQSCEQRLLQTDDLQKLLVWQRHTVEKSKCFIKIKERIEDLIYSKG